MHKTGFAMTSHYEMCWKHKKGDLWEKAWKSLAYTMCQTTKKKRTFCYILNHVITVCFWCEHTPAALHHENGQNDARLCLPPVSRPSPAVRCHRCSVKNSGLIWALVHINSFKCHSKIRGAVYWLSWGSEVCLVHWVEVTLFLFFIKVWVRREHELT